VADVAEDSSDGPAPALQCAVVSGDFGVEVFLSGWKTLPEVLWETGSC